MLAYHKASGFNKPAQTVSLNRSYDPTIMIKYNKFHAITAAMALAIGSSASGQGFSEFPGDAGQTVATASYTGPLNFMPLTGIAGTIATLGDVDLFRIQIVNPSLFSATTVGLFTPTGLDTQIFLLTSTGVPIVLNDDDGSGTTLQSTIPVGSLSAFLGNNSPGYFILGISLSGNDPATAASQLLFNAGFASTDLRGRNLNAVGGLGGYVDSGFSGGNTVPSAYQISLTGASVVAVPEPGTYLAGALSIGALAAVWRRRASAKVAA